DSLGWPWPMQDNDLIQQWLQQHNFTTFSKGLLLLCGLQDDVYSCAIIMVNSICHHLFDEPLFSDNHKELLQVHELLYLLHSHLNAKHSDPFASPSTDDADLSDNNDHLHFSLSSWLLSPLFAQSSISPQSPHTVIVVLPQPHSLVWEILSTNLNPNSLLPSAPKTGLLRYFNSILWDEYLAGVQRGSGMPG
ncbi:hypothetical protein PAXRUDRAFT_141184, partial [Paxillus rubicundulus Ve08.2h10]